MKEIIETRILKNLNFFQEYRETERDKELIELERAQNLGSFQY